MQLKLPRCQSGKVMPGDGSEWLLLQEGGKVHIEVAESLLASISEIIEAVVCIGIEQDAFMHFGSYLYRASAVIMELKMDSNNPTNTIEILKSLSRRIDLAKDLTNKCQQLAQKFHSAGVSTIVEELEHVIQSMGEDLSLIPQSTKGERNYTEIATSSLSKEMKNAKFVVTGNQGSKHGELDRREQLALEDMSNKESIESEKDLYSIDIEDSMSTSNLSVNNSIGTTNSRNLTNCDSWSGVSLVRLPDMAQYLEPLYETFFCPLTNKIMDDPVTIESGVTYERKAISEWFSKFEIPEEISCPKSGQRLRSKTLNPNVALKGTIDEWKERNDAARMKVARAALSLASSENMILEALDDLHAMCQSNQYKSVQIRSIGIIPLLANFLDYKSRDVRCATIQLLNQLAKVDDDGKETVSKVVDISKLIKMLSSNNQPIRHTSATLLLELSKCQFFCIKIAKISGGILMLITTTYRQSTDEYTSVTAQEILKNLEKSPDNIKLMAENGYWGPLLNHLTEGSVEMKIEMACYLGENCPGPDSKVYITETASSALINMVRGGSSLSRSAAFKALRQITCYQPDHAILLEAGIVQIMVEEMFARTIHDEPVNSKNEAAAILANIFESGVELENLQVNVHGHTMASDYIIHNIILWIKNSTPEDFSINLIRILLCLLKFPKASATIVSVVKGTEASYNLTELINNPNEELGIVSIKLLMILASFMGHTLSDRLCKTKGQPESLIANPTEVGLITEKHAVSANFLAKLPHQNITLNLALLNKNAVPKIIESITWIQRTGTRASRYASTYLEGLVGTLVRFTTTLYDYRVLSLVRDYNFTSLFTELIMKTSSDEVQKLSAFGLKNLSEQSVILSKPPKIKKNRYRKAFMLIKFFSCSSFKDERIPLCPVHRGACSSQDTFCLIDANAIDRLLSCLDHDNVEVVQAAVLALCTLLDDKVDVDKSVKILSDMHAIKHVLNIVKEHKEEGLLQKSFWMIDRFLLKGGIETISDISEDRLFPTTLISAFHHGDDRTREMAEKILRHFNKMPTISANFTM
ncbi:putative U-box domain-containing protein 42 [Coffea eugenioides]|uniref:putative U-box domain-containing protein 42 n=1 Tax=Coffea eugenioides TaxID=49369 RepID=UPI000F607AFF|nr:putative U-box domain-containing protein 42 [Coffea eugenioides]